MFKKSWFSIADTFDQPLDVGSTPTFAGATLSGLTASTVVYSNASKAITSLANGAGALFNDGAGVLSYAAAIKADGTQALTGNWDAGNYIISARNLFNGTLATGYGPGALLGNTSLFVTGFGDSALSGNGGMNVNGFGFQSMYENVGSYSVGIGDFSLVGNTGNYIIQIGHYNEYEVNKKVLPIGSWSAVVSGAGTNVENNRKYRIAAIIDGVETELSTLISGSGGPGAQYDHTNVPIYSGPKTCTARKIYRRKSSTDNRYYLVGTINDNSTTTFTDTQATATFGAINSPPSNSISIGHEAKILKSNTIIIGDSSRPISALYLGGVYHATSGQAGLDFTIQGMGGNGTDKDGGDVIISGGPSTGTGTEGKILFFTSRPSTTAATENVPAQRSEITSTGITSTMISNADSDTDEIDSVTWAGGYGIVIACSITDGTSAVWKLKGTALEAIEVDADWTATADNAATYNVYFTGGAIKLQNKVGDNKVVKLGYFGI